jgi:hypothetical protein
MIQRSDPDGQFGVEPQSLRACANHQDPRVLLIYLEDRP